MPMVHDKFSENYDNLKAFARETPLEPGVYLWKDNENRIIYVGKARNLRNRLGSYFASKDIKTAALVRHAKSIETIIVSNEFEALLLENTLIKQHSPKYNINLKDGKTYPVVRITADKYPRVFRTRHIIEDGSSYFGPFANIPALDRALELIEKHFPLRKCRNLKKRKNPCLYFHLKRCLAPCCGDVPEYSDHVERVRKLLAGQIHALSEDLSAQMKEAAAALEFEKAAALRNAIRSIESLSDNNSVVDMDMESRDYIAWAAEGIFTTFAVLSMRGGRMTGQELFSSRSAAEESETLDSFITAYYSPDRQPPPRIYIMEGIAEPRQVSPPETAAGPGQVSLSGEREIVKRYFSVSFGFVPELLSGEAVEKKHGAALAMARQNAREELGRRLRERGAGPALDELFGVLRLKTRPETIEGFDISHLDGKHPVASLVSFKNGIPNRKNYRHFKLRTTVGIIDDYASMREAVRRRYSRLIGEGRDLPDLILIDGGIGQVNAAKEVLDDLKITCDVIGLAERDEEIYLPHNSEPIRLSKRQEALKVLQNVRDEAHRFASGLTRRLGLKELNLSILESVDGIGPTRALKIMENYGELEKIASSKPDEMAEKCGISLAAAKAVKAAVKIALEDGEKKKRELAAGKTGQSRSRDPSPLPTVNIAALADEAASEDEAFAAEDAPDYKRRTPKYE